MDGFCILYEALCGRRLHMCSISLENVLFAMHLDGAFTKANRVAYGF